MEVQPPTDISLKMPLNEPTRQKLTDLHKSLLALHKVLLDDERKAYEKINGRVETSAQLLNLVMYDSWFDWLHKISETVVKIDELMEDEEATYEDASDILSALRTLFQSGEPESDFFKKYKQALTREPAAVLAHIDVQRHLVTDA
jgi:hypothetical protein